MNWSRSSLVIIILLLAGCSQRDTIAPETPTPFQSAGMSAQAPIGDPITISLANLAANPETFEGANVRLSGQYQALPRLICESDLFPSPATWSIVADGLVANASGQDQQLRQLLDDGQSITAIGRWLRYSGPVGCGKSASEEEIWYLSLSRITDPHPLARATTPLDVIPVDGTAIAELPATATMSLTEVSPGLPLAATLEASATAVLPPSGPSPLPPTATSSPILTPTMTPSATLTGIPTEAAGTITATATISATAAITTTPGTLTPTPDASATPEATATTPVGVPNAKGDLEFEELVMSNLNGGVVDRWDIEIQSTDFLTITVAPAVSANMIISVIDPNGQILVDRQNLSPAGGVETVADLSLRDEGTYQIHISSTPADPTNYALMVLDSTSYEFAFRGTLNSGEQVSDNLAEDVDVFWFFNAEDSDTLSIEVTPNGETDAYVELYGPDSARLLTLDEEIGGIPELLTDYSILESGMYAIRVGEFDFEPMIYQIIVNLS